MSLEDAFIPAEQKYRAEVMAHTWGHLAPVANAKYPGEIVFCHGEYGDITVIRSDFGNLPGSPWFAEDEAEFVGNLILTRGIEHRARGTIHRWVGYYIKYKTGWYRFVGKTKEIKV